MSDEEQERDEAPLAPAEDSPSLQPDVTPSEPFEESAHLLLEDSPAAVPVPATIGDAPPFEEEFAGASSIDSIKILVTCVLAWAVPGLGHVASGRFARGLLFAVVVLGLFVGGIALDGKVYRPEQGEPLTYLAAVGAAGVGLPYVVAHSMGRGLGDIRSASFEYGNTFTLVAGLLNLLIVLDAYDVASGRR